MGRIITGFSSIEDIKLTLAEAKKNGKTGYYMENPVEPNIDYLTKNGGLYIRDNFSKGGYGTVGCGNDPDDVLINFRDYIKEINGSKSPTVTFDNIKDFVGKKFKATKNGDAIEGIIIHRDGIIHSPELRFNNTNGGDTGWTAHDYPGYSRGWGITSSYDLNYIKDMTIIEDVDKSADAEIPKYFFVKKDKGNVLWDEYINWLNKTYKSSWAGGGYNYYGYDGSPDNNGTDAFDTYDRFGNNAKEITLEFWNKHMNDISDPILPVTATETTQSYNRPTTTDATDPKTGIKYPTPYGTSVTELMEAAARLKTADPTGVFDQPIIQSFRQAGKSTAHKNLVDAARYGTAVSYAGDRGRAGDVLYVDDAAAFSGPYLAQKVPVKKSRYSSMLDLI